MTAERLLLDTDVLVEYLRGRPAAVAFVEALEAELVVSAITVAELFAGARPAEESALATLVESLTVVPVTNAIASEGGRIRRQFRPSHGTGLADALIAATSKVTRAALVTFNLKHYPMLDDAVAPYPRS